MKKILYSIFFAFSFAVYSAAAPQAVIFDTDMGNDIDDALAQAMLLNYEKSGKVKIRAIVVNKDNPYSPLFVKAINDYYSRSDIPVGFIRNGATKKEGPLFYLALLHYPPHPCKKSVAEFSLSLYAFATFHLLNNIYIQICPLHYYCLKRTPT